jgi:hypothetical protein
MNFMNGIGFSENHVLKWRVINRYNLSISLPAN